jgi:sterol desaturase/sphingolipid hydroxylase (fatty acid hydroxylase superfamily)
VPNYIALAVPFFLALIGLEVWAAKRQRRRLYRFNDAVVDLSTGISQQVALIFFKAVLLAAYALVYRYRPIELPPGSVLTWVLAIVLIDLSYYWWHRLSHQVNFLWAAHVVHHSSEEYNLAVALRQGVLTPLTILPFHLPLALLGIPPLVFLAVDSFNTLYQFWIHTQLVDKLGSFEKWINTPASHRVHHAINPRYLDKNFGGTFIVWDRLFGTYEPETEQPVYGIVKALRSFDPLVAQFHYWPDLWARAGSTPAWADKLRVFLKGPDWTPPGMKPFAPPSEVRPETFVKYDPLVPVSLARYLFVQLSLVIIGATALMFYETALPLAQLAVGAAFVFSALIAWGAFFEHRPWALRFELLRLLALAAAALAWVWVSPRMLPIAGGTLLFVGLMAIWLLRDRRSLASPAPSQLGAIKG